MSTLPPEKDRQRIKRWLDHGVELARAFHGRSSPQLAIWALLVEAVAVMAKQPHEELRWIKGSGSSWGMVGITAQEAALLEQLRIHSGMRPEDGPTGTQPRADQIDRAEDVFLWFRYLVEAERELESGIHFAKTVRMMADEGESNAVARYYAIADFYHPRRRLGRTELTRHVKYRAIGFIKRGLERDYGLVPTKEGFDLL